MTRYILIDNYTGYIWGDTGDLDGPARGETPEDAAKRLDESLHTFGRVYETHGPNYRPAANDGAYHVHSADVDGSEAVMLVWDGQDRETINSVLRYCPKVAVVTWSEAS